MKIIQSPNNNIMSAPLSTNQLDKLLDEVSASTDYYATHLAEINEINSVISTEDINTDQNLPLVKKGTRITTEIAQRILKHKLMKPIEQQVEIEKSLDGKSLLFQFEQLLKKYPDLKQLHINSGYKELIDQLVKSYILSPLLTQKLTVFSQQMPDYFEKTLLSTLLALNIAFEAKLDQNATITTYLAGLTHDVGFLHISPEICNQERKLSAKEWRAVQSHVITGSMFVDHIARDYKKDVADAVLEHHERCDGSGYPIGKKGEQLGLVGQIIGMADSLQAIRVNQFEKVGRNLRDALPFLHMNPAIYPDNVYRATVSVIKNIPVAEKPVNPFKNIEGLIDHLISRGEKLGNAAIILRLLLHLTNELDLQKDGKAMLRVITPFDKMIRQSGLVEDHVMKWLEHINNTKGYEPLNELCELDLMQNELYWQLRKARNSYINFLEQEPNAGSEDIMQHLNKITAEIDSFL